MTIRYTEDHEWISVDGDVATVGITAYAAASLAMSSSSNCRKWARL